MLITLRITLDDGVSYNGTRRPHPDLTEAAKGDVRVVVGVLLDELSTEARQFVTQWLATYELEREGDGVRTEG